MPRFSLVIATVGRVDELDRCLDSLARQSFKDFDIVVVDQNPDQRLKPILDRYRHLALEWMPLEGKGVSRARNAGFRHASGEIIGFPDDDCWYAPDVLERVHRHMLDHPGWGALSGCAVSEDGAPLLDAGNAPAGFINRRNVWRLGIEFSMFVKRDLCAAHGPFDETLGINAGTPWGAGEGTNLLLRILASGQPVRYDPEVRIAHPDWPKTYDDAAIAKANRYATGMGRVLRTHRYPPWHVAYFLARPLAGAVLNAAVPHTGRRRYYLARFRGLLSGWAAKP